MTNEQIQSAIDSLKREPPRPEMADSMLDFGKARPS